MQRPVIAGAGGGVGTTVLAAALQGIDVGRVAPNRPVHVLVCRSVMASIGAAEQALTRVTAPPVLAVIADIPRAQYPAGVLARLRMIDPFVTAQVCFPYVAGWRELTDPAARAERLLLDPIADGPEREYVRALLMTAAALIPLLDPPPPQLPPATAAARGGVPDPAEIGDGAASASASFFAPTSVSASTFEVRS